LPTACDAISPVESSLPLVLLKHHAESVSPLVLVFFLEFSRLESGLNQATFAGPVYKVCASKVHALIGPQIKIKSGQQRRTGFFSTEFRGASTM
jgi:hypothetical protein